VASLATPIPDPASQRAALLYQQHHGAVLGYCVWRLRRRDDAEEAAQTTFTRALGALRRGHLPRNERAWLVTIARNVCTTLGTAPHRAREIAGEIPDAVARETDHGLGPDVEAALAALPEGQRRALLLREWQELSYREIAAELGVSVGTVESWIFRARRSLASALEHTRRGFGLAGLLRSLAPGAGAKVAAAAVLATAVVATEQAVEGPHSTKQAQLPTPARVTSYITPAAAVSSSAPAARVPRVRRAAPRPAHVSALVAGGARPDRSTPAAASATPAETRAAPVGPQPAQPPQGTEPAPAVETPELPVPTPALPVVQTPELPELPALPAVEVPALPSTGDLPVDVPTLP
jgi:RNA polymerase sigma factor (sigma-70 family)